MSTIIKVKPTRFVRTVSSGLKPNTQFVSTMKTNFENLKLKTWSGSLILKSELTINNPAVSIENPERHDAYKLSSNAVSGTGSQDIFSGMAIYRIQMPTAASSSYIESVSFDLAADKYCVGGLKVAAILSDNEVCPTDWEMLRTGGYETTPVAGFSTIGDVETSVEVRGVLAETSDLVSTSVNRTGTFTIDLSSVTTPYNYLYLAISLFDYTLYRREYWVEGSGILVEGSIELTCSGSFTYNPDDKHYIFMTDLIDANAPNAFDDFSTNGAGITLMRSKIVSALPTDDAKTFEMIDLFNKGFIWTYYPKTVSLDFSTENRSQSIYHPATKTFLIGFSGTTDIDCLSAWVEKTNDESAIEYVTTVGRFFCPYRGKSGEFITFNRKAGVGAIGTFSARMMVFQSTVATAFPDFSNELVLTASCPNCLGFADFDNADSIVKVELKRDVSMPYILCFILITNVYTTTNVGTANNVCGFLPTEYGGNGDIGGFDLNNITIGA